MDTDGSAGTGVLGRFWAAAIGAEFRNDPEADPAGEVVAPVPGGDIAMCMVPEARTVKHRVHIDVNTGSVEELVALGASVLLPAAESGFGWTQMTDPEGGEFCAFVREALASPVAPASPASPVEPVETPYRLYELGVDCADPQRIAHWWGERFGVEAGYDEEHGWAWLEDIPGVPFESIVFAQVPEPKAVKNRIHWDVYGDVAELEAAGATRLWETPKWVTLADPEGNEFCCFAPS
ncbi:MAG TPA: VOC family protein [Nocardioidaceae bacterium]|nr:VOC family protein [Nocardioidaceae bacterium]